MGGLEHGSVTFALPDGSVSTLLHGDLIGRLWTAALRVDDPRVSEAHAMVSCRGRELKLLALRGRFTVDGEQVVDVVLREGMAVCLAPDLTLTVVSVSPPRATLALSAPGVATRVLPGLSSLYGGPNPEIRPGWRPDADGWVWPTGDGWLRSGEPPTAIGDGDAWELRGARFLASTADMGTEGAVTRQEGSSGPPLRLVLRYDTVHIHREGHPLLVLVGASARLMTELALMGQPCSWEALAEELWGALERNALRRRWDMQLHRLREKLRAASIHPDLVRPTGSGLVELVLRADDVVVDAS